MRAVILTAEGRGFNAGIDIKEMQSVEGFEHLLGSGAACFAAFEAIYQCPLPTIAAVNDFCMGLGVGLVGSCDILVASHEARFGLPEVDNGALGCASHLAKLVPPMKLRQMVLTCEPVTAAQLYDWGSVYKLCEPEELMAEARATAAKILTKRPRVVRAAKTALNLIDPFDLQTQLPPRAGLHLRAEPLRRRRPGARRLPRRLPLGDPIGRPVTAALDGKVCVVTGAARGIGAATTRELVGAGAVVVMVDRRDELGAELAAELGEAAGSWPATSPAKTTGSG